MARKTAKERIAAARKADAKHDESTNQSTNKLIELEYHGAQIPREIANRLRKASVDRKADRREPYKLREITAAALAEWLEKYGH